MCLFAGKGERRLRNSPDTGTKGTIGTILQAEAAAFLNTFTGIKEIK